VNFRSRLSADRTATGDILMRELVGRAYAFIFARPGHAQAVNNMLYKLALKGMGFNNTWKLEHSGEAWFVRHVLSPTSPVMCIDVGANRGGYSRILLTETDAQVIAFEPLAGCQPALDVLANEHKGRLIVVAEAVGDHSGVMTIHYGDNSELASLSEEVSGIDFVSHTHIAPVRITTLDEYLTDIPRVDFLKIDAEGFEFEVLTGAQKILNTRRPRYVQVEMNLHQLYRGHTLRGIGALLNEYAPFQLLPRGMRPVDLDRPEANTFAYSNFVFVYKGPQRP
jgi:FkbM family methyltransferase